MTATNVSDVSRSSHREVPMRLVLTALIGTLVALSLTASPADARRRVAKKISCAKATAILTAAGHKVLQTNDCNKRIYTISTVKGEAVLVLFDSKTGKWENVYGGD
jgi:hypothetical protein